jgi:hypothetical protein
VTRKLSWSHAVAFFAGAILMLGICWWWTAAVRRDLDWAVQKGIWLEAHYQMCRQGIEEPKSVR